MLQVHDSYQPAPRKQWNRKECLIAVFGQFIEAPEAGILESSAKNGDRFAMLGDPSSDALADAQLQAIKKLLMRIFRSAQNEVLVGENINETRITLDQIDGKIEYPVERLMKSIGRRNLANGGVQNINLQVIDSKRRRHDPTLSTAVDDVQSQFFMD